MFSHDTSAGEECLQAVKGVVPPRLGMETTEIILVCVFVVGEAGYTCVFVFVFFPQFFELNAEENITFNNIQMYRVADLNTWWIYSIRSRCCGGYTKYFTVFSCQKFTAGPAVRYW